MNASSQNKLLKTLEEPPKNVYILIGTTGEHAILPTVKSRVKTVEIAPFTSQTLIDALKDQCPDLERLKNAVACGDGTVGRAVALYQDQTLKEVMDIATEILVKMQSSKQVLEYSNKILKSKLDMDKLLNVLEVFLRDMLVNECSSQELIANKTAIKNLAQAQGFTRGALISLITAITDARRRKQFNANPNMLTDWLLFKILEEKFKWQKL